MTERRRSEDEDIRDMEMEPFRDAIEAVYAAQKSYSRTGIARLLRPARPWLIPVGASPHRTPSRGPSEDSR